MGPPAPEAGKPVAAATLPSRDVLVFDRGGRLLNSLCGPFETVKDRVVRDLGATGSYFRIVGRTKAYPPMTESESDRLDSGMQIEITLTAIECTPQGWPTGCIDGQPAGFATFIPERDRKFTVPPNEIWALIRAATLRSRDT